MEKVYEFRSGTIYVMLPESCDQERLKKVTEEFLKKVIIERKKKHGNTDTRENI